MRQIEFWNDGPTGTLSDMLLDEFGGEEVFAEEIETVKFFLNAESDEIVFTTSDDDFTTCCEIEELMNAPFSKVDVAEVKEGYQLCEVDGFRFVHNYAEGGLISIFVRANDKDKLQNLLTE